MINNAASIGLCDQDSSQPLPQQGVAIDLISDPLDLSIHVNFQ